MEITYDLETTTGYFSKGNEIKLLERNCTHMFTVALSKSQEMKKG